ncbi:MAG TPA: hypothetical protein VGQ76_07390 [Thermoanaerobaculia bacterium]|jgi:hypothetical protein|nr:hypothetical protein [Thermoanaerobaculia bacterium]
MKKLLAVFILTTFALVALAQTNPAPIVPRDTSDPIPRSLVGRTPRQSKCKIQNNNTGKFLAAVDANGNVIPDRDADGNLLVNNDALFKLLSAQARCPGNALEFRDLVLKNGMSLKPSMVANRGFHNPLPQGSFSFFEAVIGNYAGQDLKLGDWFFGHFTAASIDNTALTSIMSPQQAATPDNLLLETLVWDPVKQVFNFYEIRGNGEGGIWFYRGDSNDIMADIKNLHRAYDPSQPIFMGPLNAGQATMPRLRCSGCHMNGGPIMKELKTPHDSWWRTSRPLDFGALRIAVELKPIVENVVTADDFSQWIKLGDEKLFNSAPYWKRRSALPLQEQLRPIFCEQEVNLESDPEPLEGPSLTIAAPVGAFVDQRLVPDIPAVTINKALYIATLTLFNSQFFDYQSGNFPNSVQPVNQIDGDHAFEVPVKAHTDMLLAQKMISSGLIDEKFLFDVISVDMTNPMFSRARCSMLQLVPSSAPTPNWKAVFQQNLANSTLPAAKELLANMKDATRTPAYYQNKAKALITMVQTNAANQQNVNGYVRLLAQRRIAVYQDQISQHPQGQIFEPGFRLIFPTMQLFQKNQQQIAYGGVPAQYWLNPATGTVQLTQ